MDTKEFKFPSEYTRAVNEPPIKYSLIEENNLSTFILLPDDKVVKVNSIILKNDNLRLLAKCVPAGLLEKYKICTKDKEVIILPLYVNQLFAQILELANLESLFDLASMLQIYYILPSKHTEKILSTIFMNKLRLESEIRWREITSNYLFTKDFHEYRGLPLSAVNTKLIEDAAEILANNAGINARDTFFSLAYVHQASKLVAETKYSAVPSKTKMAIASYPKYSPYVDLDCFVNMINMCFETDLHELFCDTFFTGLSLPGQAHYMFNSNVSATWTKYVDLLKET